VRQTNEHNALLITNAIEWVSATQEFILSLYTQPEGYSQRVSGLLLSL